MVEDMSIHNHLTLLEHIDHHYDNPYLDLNNLIIFHNVDQYNQLDSDIWILMDVKHHFDKYHKDMDF